MVGQVPEEQRRFDNSEPCNETQQSTPADTTGDCQRYPIEERLWPHQRSRAHQHAGADQMPRHTRSGTMQHSECCCCGEGHSRHVLPELERVEEQRGTQHHRDDAPGSAHVRRNPSTQPRCTPYCKEPCDRGQQIEPPLPEQRKWHRGQQRKDWSGNDVRVISMGDEKGPEQVWRRILTDAGQGGLKRPGWVRQNLARRQELRPLIATKEGLYRQPARKGE